MEHNTLGHSTIRHSRCELLLENSCSSTRCPKCEAHRKSLHAMLSRKKKESSSDQAKPSSHSNFRYLATPVKVNRLAQTHTLLRQKTQYIERLKLKIEKLQGVTMDSSTHDDLQANKHSTIYDKTEEYLCDSEKSKLILSATLVAAWVQDLVRAPRLVGRGDGLCRRDG